MIYALVMKICSAVALSCSNPIEINSFNNHYDCVAAGYRVAHNTFLNLEKTEEFERERIEKEKLVIKFECKELKGENT